MELTNSLRDIIGRYGLIAVHQAVEQEMRETYNYLEKLYGNSVEPEEKSVEVVEKILEIAENFGEAAEKILEDGEKSGELAETGEKKVWPFVKSGELAEKEIAPARKKLKEEIEKRKEEIQTSGLKRNEILSKENLEKLISEGLGYTEIGRRLGRMPNTIKSYCDKYNIQIMRNVRKTIPDSLKKYLDDEESKKQLISENKKEVKKLLSIMDKEWINNTKLCIYGVFRKNDM